MNNHQSDRLSEQHKIRHGVIDIFCEAAKSHDKGVGENALLTFECLKQLFPKLTFRHRKSIKKKEINAKLQSLDPELGKTLILDNSEIKPDGGVIEVLDDNGNWRIVLVTEAKHQGKDIENIRQGIKVGKKNNQDLMAAGNAIERSYKNIEEIANLMLDEIYFPYVLFLAGSNFLTHDIQVKRPNGEVITLKYTNGTLNRLDRLTAANYGLPLNTNLCKNKFISCDELNIMLQAVSIYAQPEGELWDNAEMVKIMLDISQTSIQLLAQDLFNQLI